MRLRRTQGGIGLFIAGILSRWGLCLGVLSSWGAEDKLSAGPANVLLIMADDIGFECFGTYGSEEYSTPRLDALAEEGIRFERPVM